MGVSLENNDQSMLKINNIYFHVPLSVLNTLEMYNWKSKDNLFRVFFPPHVIKPHILSNKW